jgi:aminopeptidase N
VTGSGTGSCTPTPALGLLESALPTEDQDVAVTALSRFALDVLTDKVHPDPEAAARGFHAAALARLDTASPGSGLQLAALRAVIASCVDVQRLHDWAEGRDLPAGMQADLDLRWRILVRLASLAGIDRPALDAWLERERTTEAVVHHVHALCAIPDAEAKELAWSHFTGEARASNHEVEAAGRGMWRRGQETVTGPYVARYFSELPQTTRVRAGWLLADAAREFFPRLATDPATVAAARSLIADESLDPSLRRALVDSADDLARAVRSRRTFPR